MIGDVVKKGLTKLQQDGPLEFSKATCRFISYRAIPKRYRFLQNTYRNYLKSKVKYSSPAKPYKTIHVNPTEVEHRSFDISVSRGLCQVRDGEWDNSAHLDSIDEHTYVKGLYERYKEGKAWEETEYVAYAEEKIDQNGERWGCSDVDEFINDRCAYVDEVYEDIKDNGYNPETQSGSDNKKYDGRGKYKQELEPLVLISRDGEIIWRDGYHRYAIANILNLSIPVNVLCRHQDWQLHRDEVAKSDEPMHDPHPDLQDVA